MSLLRRACAAVLWIASTGVLIGCGSIEAYRAPFRAPLPPTKEVQLFIDTVPATPFSEVGLVQVIGHGNKAEQETVLDAMRREGKQMGCDAIVRLRFNQGATMSHAIGVCVVWADAASN